MRNLNIIGSQFFLKKSRARGIHGKNKVLKKIKIESEQQIVGAWNLVPDPSHSAEEETGRGNLEASTDQVPGT